MGKRYAALSSLSTSHAGAQLGRGRGQRRAVARRETGTEARKGRVEGPPQLLAPSLRLALLGVLDRLWLVHRARDPLHKRSMVLLRSWIFCPGRRHVTKAGYGTHFVTCGVAADVIVVVQALHMHPLIATGNEGANGMLRRFANVIMLEAAHTGHRQTW